MIKPLSPILVRLLAFVIFIAVFSGAYLFFFKENNQPVESKNDYLTSSTTNQTSDPGSSLYEKPAIIKNKASPAATPDTSPTNTPEVISAPEKPLVETKIQIGDITRSIQVALNTTLYEAMEKLAVEGKITWKTKEFGGLGSFVDSLNGVMSDRMKGKYWIFYVNGEPAKVGISNYVLRNNDLIKWNYEDSQF